MSSYLSERHSRSMNTLSIQRPRPSIEIWMPAGASLPVKAVEVNCEPWTPFCLSSSEVSGVNLLLALHDESEDLAGQVALEGADCVELRMTRRDAARDEVLGSLIGPQPADSNNMQRTVGATVPAAVQAMPDRFAGRGGNRADPAKCGEAGFRTHPFGISAGCQQQLRGSHIADRVARHEVGRKLLDDGG